MTRTHIILGSMNCDPGTGNGGRWHKDTRTDPWSSLRSQPRQNLSLQVQWDSLSQKLRWLDKTSQVDLWPPHRCTGEHIHRHTHNSHAQMFCFKILPIYPCTEIKEKGCPMTKTVLSITISLYTKDHLFYLYFCIGYYLSITISILTTWFTFSLSEEKGCTICFPPTVPGNLVSLRPSVAPLWSLHCCLVPNTEAVHPSSTVARFG